MQRDAQVRACLTTKRLSVLSEGVEVQPSGDSPDALAAAAVVQEQLAELPGGGASGIVSGALEALATGWAIGEMVWGLDGTLAQVRWHDPRRFALQADETGAIAGVTVLDTDVTLPVQRFVLYAYQPRYGSPYGESDLVAAYEPWARKQTIRRMWLTALDRFGSPLPVAHVPSGYSQADCDSLANRLSASGGDSSLVIPADVQLDAILDSGRSEPAQAYVTAIGYEDTQIARAILGQELTTQGSSSGSGSLALGQVHQGVLDDWIQALRTDIALRVLTEQIARRIVDTAIGPGAPCPRVSFPNLTPAEMEARRALVATLISGGVVAPGESWLRAYLGIPAREIVTGTEQK